MSHKQVRNSWYLRKYIRQRARVWSILEITINVPKKKTNAEGETSEIPPLRISALLIRSEYISLTTRRFDNTTVTYICMLYYEAVERTDVRITFECVYTVRARYKQNYRRKLRNF